MQYRDDSTTHQITAYIGMGSNLADPVEQLYRAHKAISAMDGVTELTMSSFYHSPPMGPQDQPDYVNAVLAVTTRLSPLDLLHGLQTIENEQGRVRGERWGARTLDLDVLLYGDQCIDLPELTVPHVGLTQRAFVLYPLHEISPQLYVPNKGELKDLLARCPMAGLKRLDS
ncbi:2-amino-4-hydroxy-6-hydroxymethyldihyropteridine pyrophosphokinase [Crenothrix polyspora]|uniref:2-amino-4-hydroxy-6-hydroxymethyldihydropteridine pyrophosphokinase n=1 Tax=Crenothrix polyspora TaxID=360316 RepID=A0A1R4HIC1_9GAMM|nr:2-amino-4-hydroxy-6-hydroxymethyldihydropteridine diphosphokinase [Crenothrix polyspora]SJM95986.1 2-amino-4-hydroxy-6-hydroxymethyldihyropteridine pyrophosphokinase [Crenothrix polyspora]